MSYDPDPAPVPGPPGRPVTYDAAESIYRADLAAARDRYAELSDRDLGATAAKILRERGEFDPANTGHQLAAAREPLSAASAWSTWPSARCWPATTGTRKCSITPCGPGRAGSRSAPPTARAPARPARTTGSGQTASTTCSPGPRAAWAGATPSTPRRPPAPATRRAALAASVPPATPASGPTARSCALTAGQDGRGMHGKLPGQACTATAERNAELEAGR